MTEDKTTTFFRYVISPVDLARNLYCLLKLDFKYNTENDVESARQEHIIRSKSFITLT